MNRKTKTKITPKKIIIAAVIVLLLVMAGILLQRSRDAADSAKQETASDNTNPLDPSGPTDAELEQNDQFKEDLGNQQDKPVSNTVTPVIIDAGQYDSVVEVRSYIADLVENGGTCTLTLSLDGQTVTRKVTAFADATTTVCPSSEIPVSEFSKSGTWQLKLVYSSSKHSGTANTEVEVNK